MFFYGIVDIVIQYVYSVDCVFCYSYKQLGGGHHFYILNCVTDCVNRSGKRKSDENPTNCSEMPSIDTKYNVMMLKPLR